MSFLESMEIRWKVYGEVNGFEYSFVDYTIKGYSGQYYVQVEAVIQLTVDTLQDHHTAAKKFIIQSDNASGFASQELIQFIFSINNRLDDEKKCCVEHMDIHRSTDRKNTIGHSLLISK